VLAGESGLRVQCSQVFKLITRRKIMLDFLFSLGQAASALVLLYGGFLVLIASRKAPALNPELEDQLIVLKHLHNDA
jgi:hypothetical protein